jgi:TonB family protein
MQTVAISSTIIGTDSYMSPETFEGKRSIQTDIWAVGVVLYQLLKGSLPFPQEHPSERMFAIIQKDFEPLSGEVPFKLQQIIKKALAKLPENRFESAMQMRNDLQHFVSNVSSPIKVQVKTPGTQLNKQNSIVPILKENRTMTAKVSPNLKRNAIDTRIPKIRLIHSIDLGMQRFFNWVHLILPEWVLPCFLLLIILSIGAYVCGRKPEVINDSSIMKTDTLNRNSNLVKTNSSTNLWVNANNSSVTANIITDTERVNNNKSDNLTKLNVESKNEGTPKPKSIEIPNPIDFETQNESTPKPNELPKPIEIERKNESTPKPKTISTPNTTPKPTPAPEFTGTVSRGVLNDKASSLPTPRYPAAARAVRATGSVSVQVLLDEEGNVVSANATSGHPLLRSAAEEAARSAKFNPTVLSGQKVKVFGILTYNFVAQ